MSRAPRCQGRRSSKSAPRAVPGPLQEAGLAASWQDIVIEGSSSSSQVGQYLSSITGNKVLTPAQNAAKDKSTFMYMLNNIEAVPTMMQYVCFATVECLLYVYI